MKIKAAKIAITSAALALAAAIPSIASAQPAPAPQAWRGNNSAYQQANYDRDDGAAFRKGFKNGRNDALHRREPRPDRKFRGHERDDRQAYTRGYWQGYNSVRQNYGGHDRDGGR